MNDKNSMPHTPAAIYTDEAMTLDAFRSHVGGIIGKKSVRPSVRLHAPYDRLEYLNSPAGLIVLAHHDTIDGQVDGIHPAAIGKSIQNFRNIIEPLKGSVPGYNVHYMTRRSQGALVLEAFGRMIDAGDDEAHCLKSEGHFQLDIYATPIGPLVGVIDNSNRVYVIRPASLSDDDLNCEAFIEAGDTPEPEGDGLLEWDASDDKIFADGKEAA